MPIHSTGSTCGFYACGVYAIFFLYMPSSTICNQTLISIYPTTAYISNSTSVVSSNDGLDKIDLFIWENILPSFIYHWYKGVQAAKG